MFGLFQKVKDRLFGDIKKKAAGFLKEVVDNILAMAKSLDADGNGVKDHVQIQNDLNTIAAAARRAFIANSQFIAEVRPAVLDLIALGGHYYVKFGPKKPVAVVAELEAAKDAPEVA